MAKSEADSYQIVETFFEESDPRLSVYVGIDPGSEGAIAFLCGRHHAVIDMPVIKETLTKKTKGGNKATRTIYDPSLITTVFSLVRENRHRATVCLEKSSPRPTDGVITAFSVGTGFGMWPLFLHSQGIRLEQDLFVPAVWKRKMALIGKDKEASRALAQRLWPGAPLTRKGDHNRAEALLIAEVGRREWGDHR